MKFVIDQYIKIADKGHPVCQDYALGHQFDDGGFIIALSDGCSSEAHTDIGSRVLVHSAINNYEHLKRLWRNGKNNWGARGPDIVWGMFGQRVIHDSLKAVNSFCIEDFFSCLHATLMVIALVDPDDPLILVAIYGDGVMIRKCDGIVSYNEFNHTANMPPYPIYMMNQKACRAVESAGKMKINSHDGEGVIGCACDAFNPQIYMFPVKNDMFIGVASDGIAQVSDRKQFRNLTDVVSDMTSFKTTKGKFIQRRMARVTDDWSKAGLIQTDDVSFAGVYVTEEQHAHDDS